MYIYTYMYLFHFLNLFVSFFPHFLFSSISFLISLFLIFLENVLQLNLVLDFLPVLKVLNVQLVLFLDLQLLLFRGGSRTAAPSKMEHYVMIANGWKPLTIITKRSILDFAAALVRLCYLLFK